MCNNSGVLAAKFHTLEFREFLTKHYLGNQIKGSEMSGACYMLWGEGGRCVYRILMGRPKKKRLLG